MVDVERRGVSMVGTLGRNIQALEGSFNSQISELSESLTESCSVNDYEEYYDSDKDDMVFSNGEFDNGQDFGEIDADGIEDIFELETESDPETGSVHDLNRKAFSRPKLHKSLSTSADDRYVHLNQYKLMDKTIGEGTTSIVKLAINKLDNNRYAMKILSKAKLMKRAMLFKKSQSPSQQDPYREIAILRKLNHPNIVKLIDVLDDPEEDDLYMVFELMEGGKVLDIPTRSPLTEKLARQYFRDILSGVEYLHLNRIIHRDLKPDNMLLDDFGTVKIADFGLSGEFVGADDGVATPNGTPAFTAPECLDEEKTNYSGQAIDMWSLGITLFALVYGDVPFQDENVYRLYDRVKKDPVEFPTTGTVSTDCEDFILRLLEKDPSKRISMIEAMCDPWITDHGKDPLATRRGSMVPVPEDLTTEEVEKCIHKVPKVKRFILIRRLSNGVAGLILTKRKRRLSANSESDMATPTNPVSQSPTCGSTWRRGSITSARLLKRGRKLSLVRT